jgi:hypothetical protein
VKFSESSKDYSLSPAVESAYELSSWDSELDQPQLLISFVEGEKVDSGGKGLYSQFTWRQTIIYYFTEIPIDAETILLIYYRLKYKKNTY